MATNEEPLPDSAFAYGGAGGSDQAGRYYAGNQFKKLFGRNPTESELSSLSGAYQSGDQNIANVAGGNSAVAQYFQSVQNTPSNQAAKQQADLEAKAPQYYDQVNGMFKSSVGRDATDEERKHFGSLMASGNVDAYTLGQFLTALPENVQKQDAAFRTNLNNTLQGQDSQYYNEQIMPALQAQATKQGRSLDSSGVTNALALAAQQQNRQREGFLSGLTAQQYAGSQGLAQNAYQQAYGNYNALNNYSMQRSNQMQDAVTGRVNSIGDYAMQKQAYDQYLQKYGKRGGWVNDLGTGLNMANSFANLFSQFVPGGGSKAPTVGDSSQRTAGSDYPKF